MNDDAPFLALIWLMLAIPAIAVLLAVFVLIYVWKGVRWLLLGIVEEIAYANAKRDVDRDFDAVARRFDALR